MQQVFGLGGYSEEEIRPYVPALVYTLYDGLYIYSPYSAKTRDTMAGEVDYKHGLKPYIYYTMRYVYNGKTIVINYTLDNFMTVYVYGQGLNTYEVKSGYLINRNKCIKSGSNVVKYDGIDISGADSIKYYTEAWNFTDWLLSPVKNDLSGLTFGHAKVIDKEDENTFTDLYTDSTIRNLKIFEQSTVFKDSEPKETLEEKHNANIIIADEVKSDFANFYEHRRAVIKRIVEDNIFLAINDYNDNTSGGFNFIMPRLSETDWDKTISNVNLIAFMQGLPMKNKYYSNYCIVTNSQNKEYITAENLFFTMDADDGYYHRIDCKELQDGTNLKGYINYELRGDPHLACYYCSVSSIYLNSDLGKFTDNLSTNKKKFLYETISEKKYKTYKTNIFFK